MRLSILPLLALLSALHSSPAAAARKPSDAILLSSVKSLTLRAGKPTSHRRVSAQPQLTCVGGSARGLYEVDVLRCRNAGAEYGAEDIAWTCQASLPPEFKLGSTDVVCEGYDSPDDAYVLKGSCAVEYRLMLTELGEEKYGRPGWGSGVRGVSWGTVLFWIAFAGVVGLMIWNALFPRAAIGGGRTGYNGGGSGGGGGGGGGDDPPPPYSPYAPKPRYSSYSRASPAWGFGAGPSNQSWRPGFWSGAAGGAAAGYAAGSMRGARDRDRYAQPGSSSWFGGGGAGPSSSSRPSAGPSSSRYESTGFGSTRRR